MLEFFARQVEQRPWVGGVVLLLLSIGPALGIGRVEFDGSPHNIFKTDDPEYAYLRDVLETFGSDDNDCLLMVSHERLFSPQPLAGLRDLAQRAEQLEGVVRVFSLNDVPGLLPADGSPQSSCDRAADCAATHPLVGGLLLNESRQATLVIVRLDPELNTLDTFRPKVEAIVALAAEIREQYPVRIDVTGIPPLRVEIFQSVQSEAGKFFVAGAIVALLTSLAVFRRPALVFITSFGPLLAAFWTLGLMGLVGAKLNVINVVLPALVVVVGLTNSFHLAIDIRRSLDRGQTARRSAADAIRHLATACGLATVTTGIGFGSLISSQAEIIRQFAIVCTVGVLLSLVAVILSVPWLACVLLRPSAPLVESDKRRGRSKHRRRLPRMLDLLTLHVTRHARPVAIAGTAITLALASLVPWLRPDSRLSETVPRHRPSYAALQECDRQFGGLLIVMVVVQWDESTQVGSPKVVRALEQVEQAFLDQPRTHNPLSILNLLRMVPGDAPLLDRVAVLDFAPQSIVNTLLNRERRRAVVSARLPDLSATQYQQVFADIERKLVAIQRQANQGEAVPGPRTSAAAATNSAAAGRDDTATQLTVRLTGTPVLATRNINQMIVDLGTSLTMAIVVIFAAMTLAFWSIRLGLLSLLPNMFPLVVTASLLVLTGQSLQLSSVLVFTICLGIAVDDTIHYLNRLRRELDLVGDVTLAPRRSSASVGTALVTSTLVLLAGFGSILVSEMPTSQTFALLACLAIASALLGDLILLPALIRCFPPPPREAANSGRRGQESKQ